jgi:hypothetical protein
MKKALFRLLLLVGIIPYMAWFVFCFIVGCLSWIPMGEKGVNFWFTLAVDNKFTYMFENKI